MQHRYDLLLAGGHVIDPSQGLNGKLDIGIAAGKIAAVEASLDRRDAAECRDLGGKYVSPGLIDLHGHWYEGSAYGIDPHICLNTGVTTAVDAGTTGFVNFPEFRKHCIDRAEVEVLAFVHVGCLGIPTSVLGELEDLRYARPIETAAILEKNRDVTLGVKIREGSMTAGHGIRALDLALAAAGAAAVPLMVHISRGADTPEILRRLRAGDIVTHCYQGRGDGILTPSGGGLLPEAVEARRRGVIFDIGHGCGSFSWETAERAYELSFYPDTISTDLHRYSVEGPAHDMPTTISKFLYLGMSLEEAILKSTSVPAKCIGRDGELGTLRPGTRADIFVFEIETGEFDFIDTHFRRRKGEKRLVPYLTVKDGRPIPPGAYEVKLREWEACDADLQRKLEETT